jgi:tellurite resistance protein TehA-like permease
VSDDLYDDLYKDLDDAEWVRRDQLQSAVAVPVGLLSLLGGGIVLYIQKYEGPASLSTVFFWCCIAVGAACYAVAAVQLVRSYHGYTYERIPWPSQIRDHHQRLR